MKRRKFLLATGSTILTGSTISSIQHPAIGLEFEISAVPNKQPSNIDSILIQFTSLKITPLYLDEDKRLDITVELDIEGESPVTKSASGLGFTNGKTIDRTKIKNEGGEDLSSVVIDGINESGDSLRGDICVRVDHPNISQKSYSKSFIIGQTDIIEDFEDGFDDRWTDTTYLSRTTSWSYEGSYGASTNSDINGTLYELKVKPDGSDVQIDSFTIYKNEQSNNNGGQGWRLYDSSGNEIISIGTNNPEPIVKDGNGTSQGSWKDGYDRWVKCKISFDWNNNEADIYFDGVSSNKTVSFNNRPLINTTGVSYMQGEGYNSGFGSSNTPTVHRIDYVKFRI
jgi:hypothetical protein